jgi:hypothetical protein
VPKTKITDSWQFLVDVAKRGIEEQGYQLERLPGRGLSNVWRIEKDGQTYSASIRTTRNRWFAFPPLSEGKRWKTLDDVDLVVVAAVDLKDLPTGVEVYIFPAKEVRARFDAAYRARRDAGQVVRDDFGMWICLDSDDRGIPVSVGSGIADQIPAVVTYPLDVLASSGAHQPTAQNISKADAAQHRDIPTMTTIADVMAWARQRVSEIAGVRPEAVKLDLKIEY